MILYVNSENVIYGMINIWIWEGILTFTSMEGIKKDIINA